ncbi:MAG: VWA domain-containing protein [Ignavibacterium sp.]|nr:VWA domain-containing protein [Ignavibacterium sp.]MDW8374216.1 VWA domain-containing protein [Ignavibacteriales bacterium]
MFRFENPDYLLLLWLIPIFVAAFILLKRRRNKLLNIFADSNLFSILLPDYSSTKDIFKFIVQMLVFALLILTIANPQVGTKLQEVKQKGIDVYICLDVSYSMSAEDIKPNRLEKAKYQISQLIQKLRGDRIGLIVFAGNAYIQFPLTIDYSAANLFLSAIDFGIIPQPGTAIASAIEMAVQSFDTASTKKAIVIITDGEDHEGDIDRAIELAKEKEINIYTIGLGSPEGAPMPVFDSQGNRIGYKTDFEGNTILTKLDEQILRDIADKSGGKYYRGNNYEDHLQKIYEELSQLEKTEFGTKRISDYETRYYYFLIPAIFLMIVEIFINDKKSKLFKKLNEKLGFEK